MHPPLPLLFSPRSLSFGWCTVDPSGVEGKGENASNSVRSGNTTDCPGIRREEKGDVTNTNQHAASFTNQQGLPCVRLLSSSTKNPSENVCALLTLACVRYPLKINVGVRSRAESPPNKLFSEPTGSKQSNSYRRLALVNHLSGAEVARNHRQKCFSEPTVSKQSISYRRLEVVFNPCSHYSGEAQLGVSIGLFFGSDKLVKTCHTKNAENVLDASSSLLY